MDAGAGAGDDTLRHGLQKLIVALEGGRFVVRLPIGPKDHLGDASVFCPEARDSFCSVRRAAMEQDHIRIFLSRAVEDGPDRIVILVVAAGKGDAGAIGTMDFVLLASFCGEKVAAVDHRGCEVLV